MLEDTAKDKILVIKHGALGDIVQGLDAFASLRAGNPQAYITLLTSPGFVSLAKMMPWFDDVVEDPRASLINFIASLRIRRHLRRNWSVIVDMQCSSRTRLYFSHFRLPTTRWIGPAPGCSDPLPEFLGVNNRLRMMKAAEMAGGIYRVADMIWLLTDKDGTDNHWQVDAVNGYAVLVPGCSLAKPQKRWPAQYFAAVGNDLLARGVSVYVVGTAEDRHAIECVLADAPGIIDLCGKTTLPELGRLFCDASYVIGNDTGPVFLAAKTGAPTLMMMGPDTDPAMSAPNGIAASWLRANPISDITVTAALTSLYKLKQ
jgi:ADP-heptose:LPS heptosyltransferase